MSSKKTLKNPDHKVIAVDLDGVLCRGEFWGGKEPKPNLKMIKKVQELYNNGAIIIIYTARQPKMYVETLSWLIKYNVPFHGIAMFVKPGADYYIDDKAIDIHKI